MSTERDFSLLNSIATAVLAYFFTIPFHEFIHFVTFYIYGHKVEYFSAGSVGSILQYDLHELPLFHRILVAGGSASIVNAIIGVVLFVILIKVNEIPPLLRLFLTQLMAGQLLEGFGYFLIGGYFKTGDWGNVISYCDDIPGCEMGLRIVLAAIGTVSSFFILYFLTAFTYHFVEDPSDKADRRRASVRLNLTFTLAGVIIGSLCDLRIPEVVNGDLPYWLFMLYKLTFGLSLVAFFYAWAGIMAKPPKESKLKSRIPTEPYPLVWIAALVLALIDIIWFAPGVYLT